MNQGDRSCPLCGAAVSADAISGCSGCPLSPGCGLTCCPACGYSWVEPEQSHLGRMLRRWFRRRHAANRRLSSRASTSLADVPVGWKARLRSWENTPPPRRRQLRAYGLCEDAWLHVLQHAPATVIRVGQTELALERDLAATILVENPLPEAAVCDLGQAGS